jgi:hypothetical protein
MAKIPTYKPTTQIKPAPVPNSKGFDEWGKDFEQMTKRINNVRVSDMDFQTIQDAKEAGASPDFKEQTPITREDRIFERQALQSNQIALSNQIRDHALQLRTELTQPGVLNANSGIQFKKQMDEYMAGVLENAPEANREYLKNTGNRYIDSLGETINVQSNALAKSQMRFNLYSFIDGNMQMAEAASMRGDAQGALDAAGYIGQVKQKIASGVASGYLPGAQAAQLMVRCDQRLQMYSVIGKFRTDLAAGNGEQSLLDFMQNPPADMSPESYKQTLAMMQGIIHTQQAMAQMNQNLITQQVGNIFNQVASGQLPPNSAEVSEVYQNVSQQGGEEAENKFNVGLSKAATKGALMQSTQFINPLQADATAKMLMDKLDPNDPNYQTKVNAINAAQAAVYANYKTFSADTAAVAMQSPLVQQAITASKTQPQDTDESGGITSLDNMFLNTDIAKAVVTQEKNMGAVENPTTPGQPQISLLSKPLARNLATALNGMSVEEQMKMLTRLQKKEPQYFGIFMRDLSNGGYTLGNQMFFALSQKNPAKQFDAMNALRMTSKDIKTLSDKDRSHLNTAIAQQLQPYNNSLTNYALPSSGLLDSTRENVTRLGAYYLFSGKAGSPATAAKMAVDAYITPFWNFTNPDGNSPLRIPKDIPTDEIYTATQYVLNHDISDKTPFTYQGKPVPNPEMYYRSLKANGHWVNLPDNSGIALVDEMGTPVKRTVNGRSTLIGILFADLANPNSRINQKILSTAAKQGSAQTFTFGNLSIRMH